MSGFLRAHEASETPPVERNTIWPRPEVFHLPLAGTNLSDLRAIAENHAEPEVADHLTVYRGSEVLLVAHDAGAGHVCLARSLPQEAVDRFKAVLGASLRS